MSDTKAILCTKCNTPADAVMVAGKPETIRCPKCGREADYKKAMSAAVVYLTKNALGLDKLRSKHIKVKRSPNPKPDFVFE